MPKRRVRKAPRAQTGTRFPHSWPVSNWPPFVYPNDGRKALWLVREHQHELLKAGAIVRIGRERVVIGEPYVRWMQRQAARVPDYQIAPNARERERRPNA